MRYVPKTTTLSVKKSEQIEHGNGEIIRRKIFDDFGPGPSTGSGENNQYTN